MSTEQRDQAAAQHDEQGDHVEHAPGRASRDRREARAAVRRRWRGGVERRQVGEQPAADRCRVRAAIAALNRSLELVVGSSRPAANCADSSSQTAVRS